MSKFLKSAVSIAVLVAGLVGTGRNAFAVLEVGSEPPGFPPQIEYDPSAQPEFIPIFRYGLDPLAPPAPGGVDSAINTPEPTSIALIGSALGAFFLVRARRFRRPVAT